MKTNTESTHTELPWAVEADSRVDAEGNPKVRILGCLDNGTGGHLVADINAGWGVENANADMIVRAVNSHAELVASLTRLLAAFETDKDNAPQMSIAHSWETNGQAIEQARALIARLNSPQT